MMQRCDLGFSHSMVYPRLRESQVLQHCQTSAYLKFKFPAPFFLRDDRDFTTKPYIRLDLRKRTYEVWSGIMEHHKLGIIAGYLARFLDGSALQGCIFVGRLSIFSLLRALACIVMVEFIPPPS